MANLSWQQPYNLKYVNEYLAGFKGKNAFSGPAMCMDCKNKCSTNQMNICSTLIFNT
jgi:hypothetical protein